MCTYISRSEHNVEALRLAHSTEGIVKLMPFTALLSAIVRY